MVRLPAKSDTLIVIGNVDPMSAQLISGTLISISLIPQLSVIEVIMAFVSIAIGTTPLGSMITGISGAHSI